MSIAFENKLKTKESSSSLVINNPKKITESGTIIEAFSELSF